MITLIDNYDSFTFNLYHELLKKNVSIEDINAIFEGDEINLFWDDEGLAERLKDSEDDTSNVQLISTIVEEDEE